MRRYDSYRNGRQNDEPHDADNGGYTQEDLERMYEEAFEGNPDAQWNID